MCGMVVVIFQAHSARTEIGGGCKFRIRLVSDFEINFVVLFSAKIGIVQSEWESWGYIVDMDMHMARSIEELLPSLNYRD